MKKITQIQISNYRAFYNEKPDSHIITLPRGENLLVYGENGSGKSSFFHALQDFFMSAKGNVNFANKINLFAKGKGTDFPHSEIQVYFKEKEREEWKPMHEKEDEDTGGMKPIPLIVSEDPTTTEEDELKNASQAFLSYRDMLKTYFLDNDKQESPNLFGLIIEKLLGEIRLEQNISSQEIARNFLKTIKQVKTLELSFEDELKAKIQEGETPSQDDKKEIWDTLLGTVTEKIDSFNESIGNFLSEVLVEINDFLRSERYFNANITLKIANPFAFLSIEKGELKKQLQFEVEYFGQKIDNTAYHHFLNEARLSALAICIYLVAIKKDRPTLDNYKILFLDDIFIGLDMSNRLPLLEILKNEFADYQIFMTTYDRAWFETAKQWLENKAKENWKFFEMYVDDFTNQFDVPVILETETLLAKALYHEKNFDYPASANYLRKAVEKLLKEKFNDLILKGSDGLDLGELDRKLRAVVTFLERIGVDANDFESINVYVKSLMNPLSHYDLNAPIFKQELKDIQKSLENLEKHLPDFSKTKILGGKTLEKGSEVTLRLKIDANTENHYIFTLQENVIGCKIASSNYIANSFLCSSKCFEVINGTRQDAQKFTVYKNPISFKNVLEKIVEHENQNNSKLTLSKIFLPNWKEVFFNSEGRTLQQLINEL